MPTPDHLFLALGFVMMACLAFFIASDPRIPWKRILRIFAMVLALLILVMFAITVLSDWFPI
jgi:energy-coupling factor transporter transmembrane protein EcfT